MKVQMAVLVGGLALTYSVGTRAAPTAIVGAEIHTGAGPVLRTGTVLFDGGKITAVGPDVAVPDGTTRIDGRGKIVTPGFVAADTQVGLAEIDLEGSSNDAFPATAHPIRAAARADDAYDPRSTLIPVARRHGVTSVISAPGGGLISGRGGWFDLLDPSDPGAAEPMRALAGLYVRLGEHGAAAAGRSRTLAASRVRAYFEDVDVFRGSQRSFERGERHPLSAGRADLAAGMDAASGRLPVVFEVHRASDIRVVLRLAKAQRLKAILLGASEGWLVAGEIAEAKVPVIVDPLANLPHRFEARNARADNAALLARAGVEVILTRRSSHNAGNLRFAVGNAIRVGFPRELAVASVTSVPASAFGVDREVGRLEKGSAANLVLWSGDPFEPEHHAERVWVQGRPQTTASRQTRLAERHARRMGLAIRDRPAR